MTSGILIFGSSLVTGFSTIIGITPYKRIGKSLDVIACGCNNEILIKTFGAISGVTGISTVVSPV